MSTSYQYIPLQKTHLSQSCVTAAHSELQSPGKAECSDWTSSWFFAVFNVCSCARRSSFIGRGPGPLSNLPDWMNHEMALVRMTKEVALWLLTPDNNFSHIMFWKIFKRRSDNAFLINLDILVVLFGLINFFQQYNSTNSTSLCVCYFWIHLYGIKQQMLVYKNFFFPHLNKIFDGSFSWFSL